MSIKIDLPNIFQTNDPPEPVKGVNKKNAENSNQINHQHSHQIKPNQNKSVLNNLSKNIGLTNIKANVNGILNGKSGLQILGEVDNSFLKTNINVSLNANNKGFSIGLTQNIQTAISLTFQNSTQVVQDQLRNFSSQQITKAIMITLGISDQLRNSVNSNINDQLIRDNNSVLKHIFIELYESLPSQQRKQKHIEFDNKCRYIIKECCIAKTAGDLEVFSKGLAKNIQQDDIKAIIKLVNIIQNAEINSGKYSEKINGQILQLLTLGENKTLKYAQIENLNYLNSSSDQTNLRTEKIIYRQTDNNLKQQTNDTLADRFIISESDKDKGKKEFYNEKTESTLRKQLDFYPHYAYDLQISSFEKVDEAVLGKQEFVNSHFDEIDAWLESGKHRLVKDFEFDKPLGMIVDRGESGFITADKIRVVLVRDGSVEGWHFLRSFLVS